MALLAFAGHTDVMIPTPTVDTLYALFPHAERPTATRVAPADIPEPYRRLLVHTHHMTVTVEGFYGQPVDVRVLESARTDDEYARKILLSLRDSGEVVQFGIVQIDLSLLSDRVRREIVAEKTPLGRVLIQNNVLRHIQSAGYLRIDPTPQMCDWFGLPTPTTCYGRLGVIFADGRPAIEVLEILAPVPDLPSRGC